MITPSKKKSALLIALGALILFYGTSGIKLEHYQIAEATVNNAIDTLQWLVVVYLGGQSVIDAIAASTWAKKDKEQPPQT